MQWTSTLSTKSPLDAALQDACDQAHHAFGGERPDLAFLFLGGYPQPELTGVGAKVLEKTGARHLVGCTAGGVVGGGHEVEHRASISLTLARLPNVTIRPIHIGPEQYPDGDAAPSAWHEKLGVDPETKPAFVLLPDPFTSDAPRLLAGLDYAYPRSVKIGGLASAASAPGQNRLYLDGATHRSGTVAIALSGALVVDTVVAQGCKPVGKTGRISKAQGHYLMEIDGEKALEFIQRQIDTLSDEERELARTSIFLGVAMDPFKEEAPEAGDYLIRNFLGVDPEHGVVAVGEQLSVGRQIRLHVRDRQTSSDDLLTVLKRSLGRRSSSSPAGALLFSCLGRGKHLYGESDHDSRVFKSVAGDVPLGGFFCNGEIGPVGGETFLHGYTSSFGLFRAPSTIA